MHPKYLLYGDTLFFYCTVEGCNNVAFSMWYPRITELLGADQPWATKSNLMCKACDVYDRF